MRGKLWFQITPPHKCGSPPHMRGKLANALKSSFVLRITPAHAGKTGKRHSNRFQRTDHPRTCGENFRIFGTCAKVFGSPPHMRGKPYMFFLRVGSRRITPAHAGKTQNQDEDGRAKSDHPRTCGENQAILYTEKTTIGSPPHMRGKLYRLNSSLNPCRITPAHAGKTV